MASRSAARVPLRICCWEPQGSEPIVCHVDIFVAELPLLLDPFGRSPLHTHLIERVQLATGRQCERIYWFDENSRERTLHPLAGPELARALFDCLQNALSPPKDGAGSSDNIQVLLGSPVNGQSPRRRQGSSQACDVGTENRAPGPPTAANGNCTDKALPPPAGAAVRAAAASPLTQPRTEPRTQPQSQKPLRASVTFSESLELVEAERQRLSRPPPPPSIPAPCPRLARVLAADGALLPRALINSAGAAADEMGADFDATTLCALLGSGSHTCVDALDAQPMSLSHVAASLLCWARRALERHELRQSLLRQHSEMASVARRLKQRLASRSKAKPAAVAAATATATATAVVADPTTADPTSAEIAAEIADMAFVYDQQRFRALPPLWRREAPPGAGRLLDAAFSASEIAEGPSAVAGIVRTLLHTRSRGGSATADAAPLPPPPPPSALAALRGGARNTAEGLSGVHPRADAELALATVESHVSQLRQSIHRAALLTPQISPQIWAEAPPPATAAGGEIGGEVGLEGARWRAGRALAVPMQTAWGLAVGERLFSLWKRTRPSAPFDDHRQRIGVPGLPGCWCPPKPRAPARRPDRAAARAFLRLVLEQNRVHTNEVLAGYAHCCARADGDEAVGEIVAAEVASGAECGLSGGVLGWHALEVLSCLRLTGSAHRRLTTLLGAQLAPESVQACDATATAAKLRGAAARIAQLEDVLVEGLAAPSDALAALRMRAFDAANEVSLGVQLRQRLGGSALGGLIDQRMEHLIAIRPAQAGGQSAADDGHPVAPDGAEALAGASATPATLHHAPAASAGASLQLDNAALRRWLTVLPALYRHGAPACSEGMPPVGDAAALDGALIEILEAMAAPPLTHAAGASHAGALVVKGGGGPPPPAAVSQQQWMLVLMATARLCWAASRSKAARGGSASRRGASKAPPSANSGARGSLTKSQLAAVRTAVEPLVLRVRASTPKGAVPTDRALLEALRSEVGSLEAEASDAGTPTAGDVDAMRDTLGCLLDLIGSAHAALAPSSPTAVRALRRVREATSEALVQAADVHAAARVDADGLYAVVGEAVGDVPVEHSDLTRCVYSLLYRKTLEGVVGAADTASRSAARSWLTKLLRRAPTVAVSAGEAAVWAGSEAQGASEWAAEVGRVLEASRDAELTLMTTLAGLSLDELRAVQGELSGGAKRAKGEPAEDRGPSRGQADARPAGRPLLLREVVSGGVGGVARRLLLAKLGEGIVPDSDEPLDLNDTYRLLPGRAPKDGVPESRYAPPLRYAEGEEEHPGRAGPEGGAPASWALLDAGQRLRPDGTTFNALRLHRIFAMQSAAADRAGALTLEEMLDPHVTLTLQSSCFGPRTADERTTLHGRSEVLRYLTNEGFALLGGGGGAASAADGGGGGNRGGSAATARPPPTTDHVKAMQRARAAERRAAEAADGRCSYVQPAAITADGATRVVLGGGDRDSCGSSKDRLRMGEEIQWSAWGKALAITRVFTPVQTHYEWACCFDTGNYTAIKTALDPAVAYYTVVHHHAAHEMVPQRSVRMALGAEEVLEKLEAEMRRTKGKISCISADYLGEKLADFRARHAFAAEDSSPDADAADAARQAYLECASRSGEQLSVLSFCGRWLPIGESPRRAGDLVVCIRETLGFKSFAKPKPASSRRDDGATPTSARVVDFILREVFIDTRLHEALPLAPGLAAAWRTHEQRHEPTNSPYMANYS